MLQPRTFSPAPRNTERRHLVCLRRAAKRRGFRIVKDWTGTWSLVEIVPPPALFGLLDVGLAEIEVALSTPLPPPKVRARKAKPPVETSHQVTDLLETLQVVLP